MTIQEALKLTKGDQVMWTDPDNGLCSFTMTILDISIEIDQGMAFISANDQFNQYHELECFVEELS